ncbi:hypothetical protein FRC17_005076 [Serendipita sp. 399]|nr:hypothetical protein FRC17_005076 [Serendipita sp. 399]
MMIDSKSLPPSYADAVESGVDTNGHDLRTKVPLNEKEVDEMMMGGPERTPRSPSAAVAGPSSPLASRADPSYVHPPYDEPDYTAAPSPSYTAPGVGGFYHALDPAAQPGQQQAGGDAGAGGETYIWTHPITHETYDTGLPFDHPDVQCLQSGHLPRTRYGLVGILSTIFWFPFGLLVMMHDKSVECKRCSRVLAKPERNHYACKGGKQLVQDGKKVIGEWKREGTKAVRELQREGEKMMKEGQEMIKGVERETTRVVRDVQRETTRFGCEFGGRREKWAEKRQRKQEKWARKIERKEERWAHKVERREAKYAAWVERKHQRSCGKVYKACGH